IQFILLFSRQGKLRLQKWYTTVPDKERKKITREIIQIILSRGYRTSSFIDWKELKLVYKSIIPQLVGRKDILEISLQRIFIKLHGKKQRCTQQRTLMEGVTTRHLGTLPLLGPTFELDPVSVGGTLEGRAKVENQDNELLTLEIVHRYVELLDKYFGNVCELDIIFNFEKAYFILDEFIIGGEVQETSKKTAVKAIEESDMLQETLEEYMNKPTF
ncbi:AP-1 complex subunit sigma-3, partial [Fukomys damarensis]